MSKIANAGIVLALALLAACGPGGLASPVGDPRLGDALVELGEGICAYNKVGSNGICQNGLAASTLVEGGLTTMNVNNREFSNWFNQNPPLREVLIRYLVKCAAPAGQTFTFKDAAGVVYTWPGDLALATGWASGRAMTSAEMEALTACLGAHVNKYGKSVTLSIGGRSATGVQIPYAADELASFPVREGCFFGELFTKGVLYVGLDHTPWPNGTTSPRACALDAQPKGTSSNECPPMVYVGQCREVCSADATGTFYESCTYGGATFRPITTRIAQSDVFTCGDGVCQFTESCSSCKQDCGACP